MLINTNQLKSTVIFLPFIVAVIFSGCQINRAVNIPDPSSCQAMWRVPDQSQHTLVIDGRPFTVQVVKTPATIQQGLSGRDSIATNGMLFVMPTIDLHGFWMKDMKFDLDLVWIKDCQVIGVTLGVPAPVPGTPIESLPTYQPPGPVDMVLEVPSSKSPAGNWPVGTPIAVQATL